MTPWKCLKCETLNSESSEKCIVCDESKPDETGLDSLDTEPKKPGSRTLFWVFGAVIVLMILLFAARPSPQPQPPTTDSTPDSTTTPSPNLSATDDSKTTAVQVKVTARAVPTETAIAVRTPTARQSDVDRATTIARATIGAIQTSAVSAERTTAAQLARFAQSTAVAKSAETAQAYHTQTVVVAMTSVARQTETVRSTSNTAQAMATQNAMATRTTQARATSTPSPRPARCQIDVDPKFTAVWTQAGGIAAGCPVGSAYSRRVAFQEFQNGYMLWRASPTQDAGGIIYVLYRSGDWQEYSDEWVDGMPVNGGYTAPSGLLEPQRGFGQLWRKLGGPNAAIGWALAPEQGSDFGLLQDFSNNAVVFQFPNKITAFMPDGKRWR